MTDRRVLRAIADRDPDGGEVEPDEAAYAAHEAWARAAYGAAAWADYRAGGWDEGLSAVEDPGRTQGSYPPW